jgi:acetyl-CoA carboxylase carboxyltransferase component
MGLEGAVKLGYRKELEAIEDLHERAALYDKLVASAYESGKGLNNAVMFEIDDGGCTVKSTVYTGVWVLSLLLQSTRGCGC